MPAKAVSKNPHLALIFGEDDHAVLQRSRELFRQWEKELGGMDHETIDARAGNTGEALASLAKLRESLNTLPFFGGGKAVWFKDCSFLGDDRTSGSGAVVEGLGHLAELLKSFEWGNVRLVVSAGKIDKRKSFYKTLQKIGTVDEFAGWSANDRDWADRAALLVRQLVQERKKALAEDAMALFIQSVGPNPQLLHLEVEKLVSYVGEDQEEITVRDVGAICTRNKQAQAFAFAESLGDRDLPGALKILDEEIWSMQFEKAKSEIGLLYGLITKVRVLLMAQELIRSGALRAERSYPQFKSQVERLNPDDFPSDRRYSPLGVNPYVLFKAMPQAKNYSMRELVDAMKVLLETNRRLVSSGQEGRMILQQALVQILGRPQDQRR